MPLMNKMDTVHALIHYGRGGLGALESMGFVKQWVRIRTVAKEGPETQARRRPNTWQG